MQFQRADSHKNTLWSLWVVVVIVYCALVVFLVQQTSVNYNVRTHKVYQYVGPSVQQDFNRDAANRSNSGRAADPIEQHRVELVNYSQTLQYPAFRKGQTNLGWKGQMNGEAVLKTLAYNLVEYEPPIYLPESRSNCFFIQRSTSRSLYCLPTIFFIGVSKSGTTDLYKYITLHKHVVSAKGKEPMFWTINSERRVEIEKKPFGVYLENYKSLSMVTEHCCLHLDTNLCKTQLKQSSNTLEWQTLEHIATTGGKCPFVSVDATAVSLNDAMYWQDDPANSGLDEIQVFTPHRIKLFVPNAKLVLIIRDPVERTISDFYFFIRKNEKLNADFFHILITNGIQWWKSCRETLSETQCAFGVNYTKYGLSDLPPGTFNWGHHGHGDNGAGRLRVGMYIVYIEKWLEVFQRRDLLVIQTERYSKNMSKVIDNELLPFLELDPFSKSEWDQVHRLQRSEPQNKNNMVKKKEVHEKTRKMLQEFYRPYNLRLAKLLNNTDFLWL